ncbi:MAG TPA: sigma factor-like helix-turn-helix DNA-binding protein [Mycobacteriales bacterium]|nr:sigma factor-like helix-turn-helix DNA-binding protein [Mycobacteriales bacterium]
MAAQRREPLAGHPLTDLWLAHAPGLTVLAGAVTERPAVAAWAVREAFVRVLRNRRRVPRDVGRHLRRAVLAVLREHDALTPGPALPREGAANFATALLGLPPEQRTAVVLTYVLRIPAAEVGDTMRLRPAAVHQHLRQARVTLAAQVLAEDGESSDDLLRREAGALELRAASSSVPGEHLADVRRRLTARPPSRGLARRLLLVGVAAGLVAAATAAVGLTADRTPPRIEAVDRPDRGPSPSAGACSGHGDRLCPTPSAPPAPDAHIGVTTTAGGTPTWPFTTAAEAADWVADPGAMAWVGSAPEVARRYAMSLGLPEMTAHPACECPPGLERIDLRLGDTTVTQLRLERIGHRLRGPWSVTGAASRQLEVAAPHDATSVTAPLAVRGRTATGTAQAELTVSLREPSGNILALRGMGNRQGPWQLSLSWDDETWQLGALIAVVSDGPRGAVQGLVVVPVRRQSEQPAGSLTPGTTFVAIDAGQVVLHDAVSGKRLRQLSYPRNGEVDSSPSVGGNGTVVWVRTLADGCRTEVYRIGLNYLGSGINPHAASVRRFSLSLSRGGGTLGWLEQPCAGGAITAVVRGPDAHERRIDLGGREVRRLEVRNDGTAALLVGAAGAGRVMVVPPATTSVEQGRAIGIGPGCEHTATSWADADLFVVQQCGSDQGATGVVLPAPDFRSGSRAPGPFIAGASRGSVVDGLVLLQLGGGPGRPGPVARYTADRVAVIPDTEKLTDAAW